MRCAEAGAQARRRAGRSRGSSVARPRCARVPCDARSEVAPRNSLHSLRSLRSNTRGESDHEARGYARRPQPWCGAPGAPSRRRHSPRLRPARRLAAPSFLGVSEGQAAGIEPVACRAPQARVQAPAGLDARLGSFSNQEAKRPGKAVGGCALARLCGGEEASPDTNSPVDCSCLASGWALAPSAACKARVSVGARTRALRQLTRRICSSAANEVSAASYAARPKPEHRSEVGAAGADRRTEAPARTLPRLCDPHGVCAKREFKVGNGPTADRLRTAHVVRRGSPAARWSD